MINSLTSLRFIFALMVFGTHCYVINPFFDTHFFKEGFVGVSFFFVLSGFIIAYNYQKRLTDHPETRKSFWVARFARVYPLHWLTLAMAVLLGGYVAATGPTDWWEHFLSSFFLVQSYIPQADYYFSFNSPSWSLCSEQLFYVLFPLIVPFANSARRLSYLFAACAILVPIGMYLTPVELIKGYWYVNPIARLPDFMLGMLIYQAYRRLEYRNVTYLQGTVMEVLAMAVFALFFFGAEGVDKVYRYSCYYWLPVSCILLVFSLQKGAISRALSNKYMIIGGEISYSFYLLHLLVILTYERWQTACNWQIAWQIVIPILLGMTILLSLASYYFFEKPMNRSIKTIFKRISR